MSDATEVAMGAPMKGTLIVESVFSSSATMTVQDCNPSFVWSDNSAMLAVPQWTRDRMQRLALVIPSDGGVRVHPSRFRVLELQEFRDGIVYGIDSPIHLSRSFAIPISDFPLQ
jgi:hypothetical protein